jgi:hypothetical protein
VVPFPPYDEALAKLLFLQEMVIKLRCKQPAKKIAALLHRARELRNHFAHPESHGYAGGVFYHHMLPLLNVLNDMFLDDAFVSQFITCR